MRLFYDPRGNTAYIALRDEPMFLESKRISDAVRLDVGVDGTVHGIELNKAARQLRRNNVFVLEVVNQQTGESQDLLLEW